MESLLSKCKLGFHWVGLPFASGRKLNGPSLVLFIGAISFFVPSTARAQDFEPWEIFAWCSIPPNTLISSTNILQREFIELPFERWLCDDLESIDIPSPPSDGHTLTVDEFNELFAFTVGAEWNDSIARYELDEYVLDKSECISFSRKVSSDAALVELAEPSFWGIISPDVSDILADLEASSQQDFDVEFWGSLSRLLQRDYSYSESKETLHDFYGAFVASIELLVRAELLNHGQIWQRQSYPRGIALICPPVLISSHWFDLARENFDGSHLAKLKVAALFYVERNIERAASQLVQQIQQRDRMQFFCGDPTKVFRDRLREQGHSIPTLSQGPGGDVFRYVSQSDMDIDCNTWKQEYFEVASRYLSEFFIENQLGQPSFNYSSPFQ